MSNSNFTPLHPVPEIGQVLSPQTAQQAGFMAVVTPDIRATGKLRTYLFATGLRTVYILTEDHQVVLLTSNRRWVELIYTQYN
jgi:hypothetical protein